MTDDVQKGAGWWGIVLAAVLLPVYVLSIGPAVALVKRTGKGREAGEAFYCAAALAGREHAAEETARLVSRLLGTRPPMTPSGADLRRDGEQSGAEVCAVCAVTAAARRGS